MTTGNILILKYAIHADYLPQQEKGGGTTESVVNTSPCGTVHLPNAILTGILIAAAMSMMGSVETQQTIVYVTTALTTGC